MTVIVIGLLVTAYFAKILLAEEPKAKLIEAPKAPVVEFREVPMALGAMEPGTQVTAAHLGTGRVRVDASLEPETLLSERSFYRPRGENPIQAATPIRSSQLYQPGERPPLEVVPEMRAVSVCSRPMAPLSADFCGRSTVDVYLTPQSSDSSDPRFHGGLTVTLLNGVRVLAVGGGSEMNSIAEPTTKSGNTVTLELTPEQANMMILRRDERGEIALSYNPDGKGSGGVAMKNQDRATMEEILGEGNRIRHARPGIRVLVPLH